MQRLIPALLIIPNIAFAGNFATCLLDKLPGVQNDAAAFAAHKACMDKHPGGMASVEKGSVRGLFSPDSGAECTLKKAANTPSHRAGQMIHYACNTLYDEPNFFDRFDPSTARPIDQPSKPE